MIGLRLYLLQRITAIILVPLVVGHIILMIYAVQNGLSANEILSRTRGSVWWTFYYGLFVFAVSIHGAIGLRAILFEMFKVRAPYLNTATWLVGILLAALGLRAVVAVVS